MSTYSAILSIIRTIDRVLLCVVDTNWCTMPLTVHLSTITSLKLSGADSSMHECSHRHESAFFELIKEHLQQPDRENVWHRGRTKVILKVLQGINSPATSRSASTRSKIRPLTRHKMSEFNRKKKTTTQQWSFVFCKSEQKIRSRSRAWPGVSTDIESWNVVNDASDCCTPY